MTSRWPTKKDIAFSIMLLILLFCLVALPAGLAILTEIARPAP